MPEGDGAHNGLLHQPLSRRDALRWSARIGLSALGASALSACGTAHLAGGDQSVAAPAGTAQNLVMIIIDACRADYLGYGHLPNIAALMRRATVYDHAWCGQMESITPCSHATISTGRFPKNDGGILGFWWEDPDSKVNYTCAPLDASDPNGLATLLADSGTPTMAEYLKRHDPGARVYTASGHKFYAADAVGGPQADFINFFWTDARGGWSPVSIQPHDLPTRIVDNPAYRFPNWQTMTLGQQDAMVGTMAIEVIKQERPRVVILNLPEMDWPVAHINGGPLDPKSVTTLMENADRVLGELVSTYSELGILDQTAFMLTSDHGVIPLEHQVDRSPVAPAVQTAGTQIVTADFHTAGFLWLEDPTRAPRVAQLLDAANMQGVSAIYSLGDAGGQPTYLPSPATAHRISSPLDRSYRYLLDTMNGADAPHVVLVYPERTGTVGAGGNVAWKGDHGGASWGSQAIPLMLAGPGIRQGYVSHFPARLVDIAPTALRLLGVPHPALDGIALADAFIDPQPGETAAQTATGRYLVPVASALRRQSQIEAPTAIHPSATQPSTSVVSVSPSY